jgi:hypothetical protein
MPTWVYFFHLQSRGLRLECILGRGGGDEGNGVLDRDVFEIPGEGFFARLWGSLGSLGSLFFCAGQWATKTWLSSNMGTDSARKVPLFTAEMQRSGYLRQPMRLVCCVVIQHVAYPSV